MVMSDERVFQVRNHHGASCGAPPCLDDTNPDQRRAYLETGHDDQFIFVHDTQSHSGSLYGGDLNWGQPVPVLAGEAGGVILDPAERAWLSACWEAISLESRG